MECIRCRLWKNRKRLLAAAFVIFIFAVDRISAFHRLTGVCEAVRSGEYIYLLDESNESDILLKMDDNGIIHGQIVLPKLKGEWWNAYFSLCADQDGSIYVYYYGKTMDFGITRYQVMACDFDTGKLTPVWDLPNDNLQIQVTNQNVYYVAREADGSAGFYCQDAGGNKTLLMNPDIPFEQVKLFAWNEDNGFLWVDWSGRFYKNQQLLEEGFDHPWEYVNICADDQGIFYTDMEHGLAKRVGWEDVKPTAVFEADGHAGIYSIHINRDGSVIAAIDQADGSRGLIALDDRGEVIREWRVLAKPVSERIIYVIKTICILAVAAAVFIGLKRLLFHYTDGMVPILLQLLLLVLPVILGADAWINRNIRETLENRMLKMQYDLLYVIADNQLSLWDPDLLLRIDWQNIADDPLYQELFKATDYSTLEKQIYPGGSDQAEAIISNPYSWTYILENGELRYLHADGRQFYGTRVLYDRGYREIDKMAEAMKEHRVIGSAYSDMRGRYIVLYVPVILPEGEAIGVMECGVNRRILIYEVERQMIQVQQILAGVLIILAAVIALLLGYSLKPLGTLRQAVEDAGKGHLGQDIVVRGRTEVTRIAHSFNHMSAQLKHHMDFIEECSKRYASFVPRRVFDILNRADITQAELGDQSEITAAVLDVESSQFRHMARKMDGDSLYAMVNHTLETMIRIISEGDGIIDHMAGNGLLAYYPEDGKASLIAAVSICETMNRQMEAGEKIPLYRMVIHYGSVRVGIIGEETRMAAGTISEAMTLVSFLKDMGDCYRIRILVTESLKQQVPDFTDRFHSRLIGYVHLTTTDSLEAVYDVYDGDKDHERRAKEDSLELFDQALQDYLAGRYYDARLRFARVLRRNPEDMVAREYIYRCDGYYQADGDKDLNVWLERY